MTVKQVEVDVYDVEGNVEKRKINVRESADRSRLAIIAGDFDGIVYLKDLRKALEEARELDHD